MKNRRIVITGMGTVNSVGLNVKDYWEGIANGKSGVSKITNVDLLDSPCQIGGEIKKEKFNPDEIIDKKFTRKMDPFTINGVIAAKEAIEMSGLDTADVDKERIGVMVGSGIGGIYCFEENVKKIEAGGHRRVSPLFIPQLITDITSGHISIMFGFRGPNYSISSACATASHALGVAFNHILTGDAEAIVAGGTESTMDRLCFAGFTQARALSTHYNDTPEKASRPFDKGRDGFVMAEGAGVLVLEELEHAKKRGATIYAEMLGFGFSGDAHHITAPCPDGSGAGLAMKNALKKAEINFDDVDLVNTHGTSTPLGDAAETQAIKLVFGDHAYKMKINSTKSMTGHTLGAAGGIESIAVIQMIREGIVHPTINLDDPDPECDLDYVPNKAQEYKAEIGISNSFGFGGHNATLVFKRFTD